MGHRWEEYTPPDYTMGQRLINEPWRRCVCCGALQQRSTKTWYMRVSGYQWLPGFPRCEAPGLDPKTRPLWTRDAQPGDADPAAVRRTLDEARRLSFRLENRHLTDAQLIRLAYWGAAGDP